MSVAPFRGYGARLNSIVLMFHNELHNIFATAMNEATSTEVR